MCTISVIHEREPGKYCGPNILCQGNNNPDTMDKSSVKWVDGSNTLIDKLQGSTHVENFMQLFEDKSHDSDSKDDRKRKA